MKILTHINDKSQISNDNNKILNFSRNFPKVHFQESRYRTV